MVPMDLYLIRARLSLLFNCMLSERCIVKMCSEINAYQKDVINECREFGVSWSCMHEFRDVIWRVYVDRVGWWNVSFFVLSAGSVFNMYINIDIFFSWHVVYLYIIHCIFFVIFHWRKTNK